MPRTNSLTRTGQEVIKHPKIESVPIETVKPNPNNPRTITTEKKALLVKSIQEFPQMLELRPLIVDKRGVILGGNMRYDAAIGAGLKKIPIIRAENLTPSQAKEFIVKDNVGFGEWEWEALLDQYDASDLAEWGLDVPQFPNIKGIASEEDDYVIPDEIETEIIVGDIFDIGEHRLLCGDSTRFEDVDKLMNGKKADMIFTDPPYGVNYTGGMSFTKEGVKKGGRRKLANDDSEKIYADSVPVMAKITDGPIYTWFAGSKAGTLYEAIATVGEIHALIIWVKNGGYGALNANYKQKHEPCLYWKPKGGRLNFCGASTETTIWEIDKDGNNKMHPTQKPVALAAKAIGNHSVGLVADLFLGSGSTMVAAHKLNRKCYGVELDPKYCQVIVDRMQQLDSSLIIKKNGKPYKTAK